VSVRVGFDLTPVRSGATGVARYAGSLHDALTRRDDLTVAPFAVGRGAAVPGAASLPVPLRVVHRSWAALRWPAVVRLAGAVDVVHATDLVPPPSRAPVVLTIHDVLPLTHPAWFPSRTVRIAEAQAAAARAVASVVLATCEATAEEIARVAGVPRDRIAVATLGHRPVGAAVDAPSPYLLFVGAVTARKGLAALVAALPADAPPLVVAGPDGHAADAVRAEVAAAGGRPIRFVGRVGDEELGRLYAGAIALCHPSEGEGFGIPVLEAMAHGVPVVATDLAPVREVAGDAAVLVPVGDVAALREALTSVLADGELRSRLGASGRQRAAARTWEACAGATVDAYRRAAA
jgi:glycosyltransferase involved in cell wall biosynthesis